MNSGRRRMVALSNSPAVTGLHALTSGRGALRAAAPAGRNLRSAERPAGSWDTAAAMHSPIPSLARQPGRQLSPCQRKVC
jgi:hypothetical protein